MDPPDLRRSRNLKNCMRSEQDAFHDPGPRQQSRAARKRSSTDLFVIPRRTRYPSSNAPYPTRDDIIVAERLLSFEPTVEDSHTGKESSATSEKQNAAESPRYKPSSRLTPKLTNQRAKLSSEWSDLTLGQSNVDSTVFHGHEASEYVMLYNELAKALSLTEISVLKENEGAADSEDQSPLRTGAKRGLWRRLVRSSSTRDFTYSTQPSLVKKSSISDLLGFKTKVGIKFKTLEDIFRLGGASQLHLPAALTAMPLLIPTCLAGTGNFLASHAQYTPGVFRIPGQTHNVGILYEHYNSQIRAAEHHGGHVQSTIARSLIPVEISCNTHDVASAFKRFLLDIPGGILGSVSLYKTLKELERFHEKRHRLGYPSNAANVSYLIALAILSVSSVQRLTLITAIFGLLALIKQDSVNRGDVSVVPKRPYIVDGMSSRALGVIFAPSLLGTNLDQLELNNTDEICCPQSQIDTPAKGVRSHLRNVKHSKSSSLDRTPEMTASVQRSHAAAALIELILIHWEKIVSHVRLLRVETLSSRVASQKQPRQDNLLSHLSHEPSTEIAGDDSSSRPPNRPRSKRSPLNPGRQRNTESHDKVAAHRAHVVSLHPASSTSTLRPDISQTSLESKVVHDEHGDCASSSPFAPARKEDLLFANHDQNPGSTMSNTAEGKENSLNTYLEPIHPSGARMTSEGSTSSLDDSKNVENVIDGPRVTSSCTVFISPNPERTVSEEQSNNDTGDVSTETFEDFAIARAHIPESHVPKSEALEFQAVQKEPFHAQTPQHRTNVTGGRNCLSASDNFANHSSKTSFKLHADQEPPTAIRTKNKSPSKIPKAIGNKPKANSSSHMSPSLNAANKRPSGYSPVVAKRNLTGPHVRETQTLDHLQTPPVRSAVNQAPTGFTTATTVTPACNGSDAEQQVARRLVFKPLRGTRADLQPSEAADDDFWQDPSHSLALRTLYAEIRRLKHDNDIKHEETLHLYHELEAMRQYTSSGTLSERLREAEQELRKWKQRAEAAEAVLQRRRGLRSSDEANKRTGKAEQQVE